MHHVTTKLSSVSTVAKYTGCILTRQFIAASLLRIVFVSQNVSTFNVLTVLVGEIQVWLDKLSTLSFLLMQKVLLSQCARENQMVLMKVGVNFGRLRYMFSPKYTLGHWLACWWERMWDLINSSWGINYSGTAPPRLPPHQGHELQVSGYHHAGFPLCSGDVAKAECMGHIYLVDSGAHYLSFQEDCEQSFLRAGIAGLYLTLTGGQWKAPLQSFNNTWLI